jgi:hypothetical protein
LRVPARLTEHPIEAAVAVALLLALLFVSSSDPHADAPAQQLSQNIAAKM